MILIGIALIAGAAWKLSLRLRVWLLLGLLLDFAVGVMLHMTLQHHVPLVVPVKSSGPQVYQAIGDARTPARAPQNNAADKLTLSSLGSPRPFWGDRFEDPAALGGLQFTSGAMLAFLLFMGLAKPDKRRVHQLRVEQVDHPRTRKPQKRRSKK